MRCMVMDGEEGREGRAGREGRGSGRQPQVTLPTPDRLLGWRTPRPGQWAGQAASVRNEVWVVEPCWFKKKALPLSRRFTWIPPQPPWQAQSGA